MKAIRVHQFGGPEVMVLEDVPDPRPGQGQVLVRLRAIGVNPVDAYIVSGNYARKPELPYTPGSDGAGVIEAVGEDVSRVKIGDRVYVYGSITGTYAELALCDLSQIHPLPDRVQFEQGAAMGVPYTTAFRALFHRGRAIPAETVLVHGATGGVGMAAVQLSRAAGLTIIGTGGTEEGRKLVFDNGAHHVLDHHDKGYLDRVMEITEGQGVNVIVEMLANVNLGRDLNVLSKKGRVVVVGNRGTVEIDPRAAMGRDADILGMASFNITADELKSIHAALVAGLEDGTLNPVVGKVMPLSQAADAHRAIMEPGALGKIVLIP
jgi:NADPH2:quinone reductase